MPDKPEKVHFSPNIQVQLALADLDAALEHREWGDSWYYRLTDGRILMVPQDVCAKINMLDLAVGEPFVIVKRCGSSSRQPTRWDVWRPGSAEKARAAGEETSELEQQLRASIEASRSRVRSMGAVAGNAAPGTGLESNAAPSSFQRGDASRHVLPATFPEAQRNNSTKGGGDSSSPHGIDGNPAPEISGEVRGPDRKVRPIQPPSKRLETSPSQQLAFDWEDHLRAESEILIDVFADALEHASKKHGNRVKPEDVRSLVITSYISNSDRGGRRGGGSNRPGGGFNAA